jgi:hypothetical protein
MAEYISPDSPTQSESGYTTITYSVLPTDLYQASGFDIQRYYSGEDSPGWYSAFLYAIPGDGKIDFQVAALVGHNSTYWYIQHPLFPEYGGFYAAATAYDFTSGWSDTVTIGLTGNSLATSTSTEPHPTLLSNPSLSSLSSSTAAPAAQSGANWPAIQLDWLMLVGFAVLGVVVGALVVFIVLLRRRIGVLERKQNGA